MTNASGLTIGRLARAANVGIETIRYYQRRELLPRPEAANTAFRVYPLELVDRIQFIKRSQELGFTLDQIATFLKLADGSNRPAIRKVAADRLEEIRSKIADLQKMEMVLAGLIQECETSGRAAPCPVIAALSGRASNENTAQ
jgi:Hg(II)-responsive transcriptional regulator